MVSFAQSELKRFQRLLSAEYPECVEWQCEDEEVVDSEEEARKRSSREAFLRNALPKEYEAGAAG